MSQEVKEKEPVVEQKKAKPVETQEPTAGKSQELHETALRTEQDSEEFKKAVAKAVEDQFKVVNAWQVREVVKFIIYCPSGQQVLVKHLDTMDLVRADLIEDLDSFQKKLFPSELDDSGRPVERDTTSSFFKLISDPERRVKFLDTTNRLMAVAAIKPRVVNDDVALVDRDKYKEIIGTEFPHEAEKCEVFGYQVKDIDQQIKLFGKPVAPLGDNEAYAGLIGLSDRFAFYTELNKPLELIAPFRESTESMEHLASVQDDGGSAE